MAVGFYLYRESEFDGHSGRLNQDILLTSPVDREAVSTSGWTYVATVSVHPEESPSAATLKRWLQYAFGQERMRAKFEDVAWTANGKPRTFTVSAKRVSHLPPWDKGPAYPLPRNAGGRS